MRHLTIALVITLTLSGSLACQTTDRAGTDLPVIYTTFPIVETIVREVTGPAVEVRRLIDAGKSPHSYEPRPSDIREAHRASAIFYAGENLDAWATEMSDVRKVSLLGLLPDSLKFFPFPASNVPDPHFWMDPLALRAVAEALPEVICQVLPPGSDCTGFDERAAGFAQELMLLDAEIETRVAELRPKVRLVLSTPFMRYFTRRYDLEVAATLGKGEGVDPGPSRLAALARELDAVPERTLLVVYEARESRTAARTVAELLGARLVPVDPIGGAEGRDSYRQMMMFNMRQLLGEGSE